MAYKADNSDVYKSIEFIVKIEPAENRSPDECVKKYIRKLLIGRRIKIGKKIKLIFLKLRSTVNVTLIPLNPDPLISSGKITEQTVIHFREKTRENLQNINIANNISDPSFNLTSWNRSPVFPILERRNFGMIFRPTQFLFRGFDASVSGEIVLGWFEFYIKVNSGEFTYEVRLEGLSDTVIRVPLSYVVSMKISDERYTGYRFGRNPTQFYRIVPVDSVLLTPDENSLRQSSDRIPLPINFLLLAIKDSWRRLEPRVSFRNIGNLNRRLFVIPLDIEIKELPFPRDHHFNHYFDLEDIAESVRPRDFTLEQDPGSILDRFFDRTYSEIFRF